MVRTLHSKLHLVRDIVAGLEVEVLKCGGVALGFEHVGNPFGPFPVLSSPGDKEMEFGIHGRTVRQSATPSSRAPGLLTGYLIKRQGTMYKPPIPELCYHADWRECSRRTFKSGSPRSSSCRCVYLP